MAQKRNGSQPRRFLFVVWEGGGTIPPELSIANQLVRRGHRVRVLGDPCVEEDARAAGCEFSSYRRAPHRHSRAAETDLLREWEARGQIGSAIRARDRLFFGPSLEYARDVIDELAKFPADVACVDSMLFGAILGAEKAGVPIAVLMPNIYVYPAPGIPPMGPGFQPARGPLGRLRDAAWLRFSHKLMAKGVERLNEARFELGLPGSFRLATDQIATVDKILVLTSRAFDFPARHLPPQVVYVGPQLVDPTWVGGWESPWKKNDPRPLVVVSFSTTFQNQGRSLSRVIEALKPLPVRALVTLGPSLDPVDFRGSENVVVVTSAPHAAVFPHASAVVTHAGHGTVLKALASGLPLVCLPMGRDQNDNAARIVASGAGIRLSPRAGVRALRRAVRRLLAEPDFAKNAKRIAGVIAQETRHPRAVEELESLAAKYDRQNQATASATASATGAAAARVGASSKSRVASAATAGV